MEFWERMGRFPKTCQGASLERVKEVYYNEDNISKEERKNRQNPLRYKRQPVPRPHCQDMVRNKTEGRHPYTLVPTTFTKPSSPYYIPLRVI
jgi:hypothetical protein